MKMTPAKPKIYSFTAISAWSVIYRITARILLPISFVMVMFSCDEKEIISNFEDQDKLTIYDYMAQNKDKYSSFLSILEAGKISRTLSAYNPNGTGYTLFLPDNDAVSKFIEESDDYNSLGELLADTNYVRILGRYHIVDMSIGTDDFPFGALPEYTLSGDLLTVSFVIEEDTSYYKINNQAPVVFQDIELSNGYIHILNAALEPVVFTTYQWLAKDQGYSIFKSAIDATGLQSLFDINIKDENEDARPFTLFIEHDSIFNKTGISSFEDLANLISPGNTDYTGSSNPLNSFVRYHLLTDIRFLDDFVDVVTNYTTYSEIPLLINGAGLDIAINKGKQNFDTIVHGIDTTIIDYVGFNYDASNVLSQSGVIHFIDQVLTQQQPTRQIQYLQFYEEPLFNEFRLKPGTYIVEDSTSLSAVKYSGPDLYFVVTGDESSSAWGGDYVQITGDFTISYTIPKLVQGMYTVFMGADAYSSQNALIEISIDGKKMGGLIDLTNLGTSAYPFARIELGPIDFVKYEEHTIEVKSLIPGRFYWDYMIFEPL